MHFCSGVLSVHGVGAIGQACAVWVRIILSNPLRSEAGPVTAPILQMQKWNTFRS